MIYLDTNVFVFASSGEKAAKNLLLEAALGKVECATSCLTWDEFVWILRKEFDREEVLRESRRLLTFPNMTFLNVNPETLSISHAMIERYGLKPRDALHTACALQNDITRMVSDDSDFDKVNEIERIPIQEY